MGTTFKYIADHVVEQNGWVAECFYCKRDAKLYCMFSIDDGSDECPPSEICVDCIKSLPVDWFSKHDEEAVRQMGSQRYPDKRDRDKRVRFIKETREEYRRTPDLPNLVNWGKWPVCCSDFTEYVGDAGKTYQGRYDEFQWYGPADHCDAQFELPELVEHPNFQKMDPFSLFQCFKCGDQFWTHNV